MAEGDPLRGRPSYQTEHRASEKVAAKSARNYRKVETEARMHDGADEMCNEAEHQKGTGGYRNADESRKGAAEYRNADKRQKGAGAYGNAKERQRGAGADRNADERWRGAGGEPEPGEACWALLSASDTAPISRALERGRQRQSKMRGSFADEICPNAAFPKVEFALLKFAPTVRAVRIQSDRPIPKCAVASLYS